ncbi:divalent cation tolerance protein CutA [Streptomyces sp. IGB124]|uniref:divalent cation tolerance protein CutA n=1 Tax=Streptomyces sp. IGB124 TaxID=1519485 RepID=UPI0006AFE79F|nr:divalent cation tolerance protein CutA [Streptomyces sp. IGB124]KOU70419.1 cation tolerance protein CutA [Streptomyces sp. IGB124]
MVIAQTSVTDEAKAYEIAQGAVEARLAAAADVEARMTLFHWSKDALRHERGYRVSFTTTTERAADLEAWVHGRHPYDVPQWIVLPAAGTSDAYLAWAVQETTPR